MIGDFVFVLINTYLFSNIVLCKFITNIKYYTLKTIFDLAPVITKVPHPFINFSLTELGIVTDIDLEEDTVSLNFAWPFPNIPIRDKLVNSVEKVVIEMGLKLDYTESIMTPVEKSEFMILEKKGWKKK